MPFIELLLHLRENGDEIVGGDETTRYTALGHKYVRSAEGRTLTDGPNGPQWETKYIWVRW